MEDKLYAHHAVQDSLELSDNEIYDYVDRQIEYFTEQLGGIDKVLEFYKKRSLLDPINGDQAEVDVSDAIINILKAEVA